MGVFVFMGKEYGYHKGAKDSPEFKVDDVLSAWQLGTDFNSDIVANVRMPRHIFVSRPRSAVEPTPQLEHPVFSNCTVPIIMYPFWLYNIAEFFLSTATKVLSWSKAGIIDGNATLVLSTPAFTALHPYHRILLAPYTKHKVAAFGDLATRADPATADPYSAEGHKVSCFQKLFVCKFGAHQYVGIHEAAQRVVANVADRVPPNPLAFSGQTQDNPKEAAAAIAPGGVGGRGTGKPAAADGTLRVFIESRQGPVRNILNAKQIADACGEIRLGPEAAPFTKVECRAGSFAAALPLTEEQFHWNLGAVRSADVVVIVHGSGGCNTFFMREGSAHLEIRPLQFGSKYAFWPERFYPEMHRHNGHFVQFWAYNIEDLAEFKPGTFEAELLSGTPGRTHVEDAGMGHMVRDRHVVLDKAMIFQFIKGMAPFLYKNAPYQELLGRRGHYANATAEGLRWHDGRPTAP